MEELTEMMTWAGLKLHSKPIAILNTEGYYDHFLLWVRKRGILEYPEEVYWSGISVRILEGGSILEYPEEEY